MRKPPRMYDAGTMASGVRALTLLQRKARDYVGSRRAVASGVSPEVDTHEGHCTGCKTKKRFPVRGEEVMRNKAIRKYGECPDCGRGISVFAPGKKESA